MKIGIAVRVVQNSRYAHMESLTDARDVFHELYNRLVFREGKAESSIPVQMVASRLCHIDRELAYRLGDL